MCAEMIMLFSFSVFIVGFCDAVPRRTPDSLITKMQSLSVITFIFFRNRSSVSKEESKEWTQVKTVRIRNGFLTDIKDHGRKLKGTEPDLSH
jgi:hypothetical protein